MSQTITHSPILRPLTPLNWTTGQSDAGGQCGCVRCRSPDLQHSYQYSRGFINDISTFLRLTGFCV